jgi:PIN domain nuclease of toxin-antitoxin system
MNVVLDASSVIAFLRGEPGAAVVERYFGHETDSLYMHALNLCEVYYDFLRAAGETSAEDAVQDILLLGVRERNDMTPDFWRAVGKLKAEHRRVSLADCCALALARSLGAVILSADRHELEPLARDSVCSVEFIR